MEYGIYGPTGLSVVIAVVLGKDSGIEIVKGRFMVAQIAQDLIWNQNHVTHMIVQVSLYCT